MRNQGCRYSNQVSREDEGLAVLAFYVRRYPHSAEGIWLERIRAGRITRNGRPVSPEEKLGKGDTLVYDRQAWDEPEAPREFAILYEDEDVIVLDKPSGLPVLPGGGFLENTLLHLARVRFGPRASPLHRLGRGTTGAILFTRNEHAARFLSKAMAERRILKIYLAMASGLDLPDSFTVDAPIGPVLRPHGGTVHAASAAGRPAASLVRVIRRLSEENASIVEVTILTGRPHQIRIHLAFAGFPLFGDPLYGPAGLPKDSPDGAERPVRPGECGYRLHSWKIRYPCPDGSGERLVIAPPPPGLAP